MPSWTKNPIVSSLWFKPSSSGATIRYEEMLGKMGCTTHSSWCLNLNKVHSDWVFLFAMSMYLCKEKIWPYAFHIEVQYLNHLLFQFELNRPKFMHDIPLPIMCTYFHTIRTTFSLKVWDRTWGALTRKFVDNTGLPQMWIWVIIIHCNAPPMTILQLVFPTFSILTYPWPHFCDVSIAMFIYKNLEYWG